MPGPSLLADMTHIPEFETFTLAMALMLAAGAFVAASVAPGLPVAVRAIANMTAVRKRYGPAPLPFIILPIVAAFFVDLANVGLIHVFSQF